MCFKSLQKHLSLTSMVWKPFKQENSDAKPDTSSMQLSPGLKQFKATLWLSIARPWVLHASSQTPSVIYKVLLHAPDVYLSAPKRKIVQKLLKGKKTISLPLQIPCDCQCNLQTARIYITPWSSNIWELLLHSWTGNIICCQETRQHHRSAMCNTFRTEHI